MLIRIALVAAMLAGLLAATPASSVAADCAGMQVSMEWAKCVDLRDPEGRMATAYAALAGVLPASEREDLAREQQAWVLRRDAGCAADEACVRETTAKRFRQLRARGTLRLEESVAEPISSWDGLLADVIPSRFVKLPYALEMEAGQGVPTELATADTEMLITCSPRNGLFDFRTPLSPDMSLADLTDDPDEQRTEGEGPGPVWSYNCTLGDNLTATVKWRFARHHFGQCGYPSRYIVSLWVNGRRVIREREMDPGQCFTRALSVTLRGGELRVCSWRSDNTDLGCLSVSMDAFQKEEEVDARFSKSGSGKPKFTIIQGDHDPLCRRLKDAWEGGDDYYLVDRPGSEASRLDIDGDGEYEFFTWYRDTVPGSISNLLISRKSISGAEGGSAADAFFNAKESAKKNHIEHLLLFEDGSYYDSYYNIEIIRDASSVKPLVLVLPYHSEEERIRSSGKSQTTRLVLSINPDLTYEVRCAAGPQISDDERM